MKKNHHRLVSLVLALVLSLSVLPMTKAYAATYTSIANGTYTIASKANETYVLDVYGNQTKNKANVQVYQKANNTTQQFSISKTSGGWYSITPRSNSSFAVNPYSDAPKNGTNVNVYTVNQKDKTQGFYFDKVNGYYVIRSAYNPSLALTVEGSPKNMANVRLETYTGKATQLWKLSGVTPIDASSSISANLNKIDYIKQGTNTCKASSVAMALNLIIGKNTYTTASMGGSNCKGINGNKYTGSDGNTYKATYKSDLYVGSLTEVKNAINKAIAAGLPIVVAVHSSGTKHHWIIIVGQSGNNYLVVDPWGGNSGSMSSNVKSMSSYELGLTDYKDGVHYGYVSFTKA